LGAATGKNVSRCAESGGRHRDRAQAKKVKCRMNDWVDLDSIADHADRDVMCPSSDNGHVYTK
jgi:hypothetical protein